MYQMFACSNMLKKPEMTFHMPVVAVSLLKKINLHIGHTREKYCFIWHIEALMEGYAGT